jgi:heme o synthase
MAGQSRLQPNEVKMIVTSNTLVDSKRLSHVRSSWAEYLELTRPRLTVMVLFTVAAGYCMASTGSPDPARLLHTVFGTALVVAGATALNQFQERHSDGLMERTRTRPLPSGRVQPTEALLFGTSLSLAGLAYLAITVRQPLTILLASFALLCYVFIYTPLKRKTTLNTLVGAVPGAIPPVIGWTAVTNSFDTIAAVLFAIVFLWQVPHFLAIAWIYRDDYSRAGFCMLSGLDPAGDRTAKCMVCYCLALLSVSLIPAGFGEASAVFFVGAASLGVGFVTTAIGFWRTRSIAQARRVLRASLIYLPGLLVLLLLEGVLRS